MLRRRTRLAADPDKARAWQRRAKPMVRGRGPKAARAPRAPLPDPQGGYRCAAELLAPGGCVPGPSRGLHRHHRQRRSQGGPDTPENLIWLCPGHHGWVHDNPGRAKQLGYLA